MNRGNGASELVTNESPFAQMHQAIIALASAQTKTEKQHRLTATMNYVKAFESSFFSAAQQLALAERMLLQLTGGEFMTMQFNSGAPAGTKVRVIDANEVDVPILDLSRGRLLKLPVHVEPFKVELKMLDGEVRRLTPGVAGYEVVGSADDTAPT